jgi:hypothetical protein
MHFLTAASLLPALALATSYRGLGRDGGSTTNSLTDSNDHAGIAPGANECGSSSFDTTDAEDAPLVSDCNDMLSYIVNDQEWTITTEPQTIISSGTCAFVAVTRGGEAQLGNADVTDLVNTSIQDYAEAEYVSCEGGFDLFIGTEGTMPCEEVSDETESVTVDWSIVNTESAPEDPSLDEKKAKRGFFRFMA